MISVAIEPNVKPPLRFRYIHTEQLIDWDGKRPSASFDKIVADLKAILKGQEPPKDTKLPELEPPNLPKPVRMDSGLVKEPLEKIEPGAVEEKPPRRTTPVTKYPNGVSPEGCYDMAGNVWEWTASHYDKDTYVLRGGSWDSNHEYARCAYRFRNDPLFRDTSVGFRCARTK